jgi:alkanesulfonate monooxygenase SsuD/methylene tetrahydromethanopterin reductase-like flavin-dependent oxidoreductase (luciferase family)
MRLGYFTMPIHPLRRNYVETLREDREAILLCDRLGYAEAYVGEHLTDSAETITDCCVFLASLVHDTEQITLGTGTVNLTNSHPAALASKTAMLDNMLEGRFIVGVSPGGLPSDWEMFGNLSGVDRRAKSEECMDHVIALWTGEAPYDREGEHWTLSTRKTLLREIGQGVMIRPYQRPHPRVVVTAAEPSSKSVTHAGERGFEVISANFLLPQWVKTHWPTYVEARASSGASADPRTWRVAKTVFVGDDEETAREYAFGPDSPYRFYYDQLGSKLIRAGRANLFKTHEEMPDEDVTTDYLLDKLVIAGSVEQVVDRLLAFRDEVGEFGTLLYCGTDWVSPELAKRSLELMATDVMPALNRRLEAAAV